MEAAKAKGEKLSPFILQTLKDALAGNRYALPVTEEAAASLKLLAASTGMTEGDLLSDLVVQLVREPYSPWLRRPGQREVDFKEVLQYQQKYLTEVARINHKEPGGSPRRTHAEPRLISALIPRALTVEQAPATTHGTLLMLSKHLRLALANPAVEIRVLIIDRQPPERKEGGSGTLTRQDEQLYRSLIGEADGEEAKDRRRRLMFKYLGVADIRDNLSQISDREFLNQFQVYADTAVCFTLETSFGSPFRYLVSTVAEDIGYWRERFENLWGLDSGRTAGG